MPQSVRAIITFLGDNNQPVDPGYGVPGGGYYPDNSLPGGRPVRPDNSLPGLPPGAVQLPVFPFDPTKPDNSLPGTGGERPDQGLPRPGMKYVVKWLACVGLILVPDQGLPETEEPEPKKY